MAVIADGLLTLASTAVDVLPIAIFLLAFQRLVLGQRITNLPNVVVGFVCVVAGLGLFLLGLEQGLFPLGRLMAQQLTSLAAQAGELPAWHDYYWLLVFAFSMAFGTTIAEPALLAVALKANDVSGGAIHVWGLRVAVALGVAFGVALGCLRIITGTPLHWYLVGGYLVLVAQTAFAPKLIVPLAYDSGGVSTSTVTVPLVTALGLGLAEQVPGRDALSDGFGLIAFAVMFPIVSVLAYAQLSEFREGRKRRPAAAESRSNAP
jgi:hypothetical protein